MIEILQNHWRFLLFGDWPRGQLGGLAVTLLAAVLSLSITFPCAIVVALLNVNGSRVVRFTVTSIVNTVRGLPLIMLIFWLYFFLPVVLGFPIPAFPTLVGAIVLYQTAYVSEIIRAGIEGLPKGQFEAARSMGLGYLARTFVIVLPQALTNVLPSLLNQGVLIVKETSLGYVISLHELTHSASTLNSMLLTKPLQVYGVLALLFFVVCFSLSQAVRLLEQRIVKSRIGVAS